MGYQPIENYGIIGDMRTTALVGMNGSIDWFCVPNFDSPSVFAAILDENIGGRFQIAPTGDDWNSKQYYLPETNILVTRFLSDEGVAEVVDYMPVAGHEEDGAHHVLRQLHPWERPIQGSLTVDFQNVLTRIVLA